MQPYNHGEKIVARALLVPVLYHGKLAKEAGRLMKAIDHGRAVQEIAGATTFLCERFFTNDRP